MNDGWEYRHRNVGFDPAVDNATDLNPGNDADADPDGDGLTNAQDCEWGTNPSGLDENHDGVPDGYDSDGDGVNDGAEIAQNSDPADASDEGKPDSRAPVSFYFGDPSGSHSEKYRLEVTPVSGVGDTPRSFSWLNENYGECETKKAMLMPGWSYEVRLHHAGTNRHNGPDYRFNSLGLLYRWKHKDWKGAYPGEIWEGIGVKYLLGYALKAPLDTDGGSSIAAAFVRNLKSGKDIIVSWRDANDTAKGRNACVIDCSEVPHQFWFWDESSGSPVWTKKEKGTVSW